MAKNTLRLTVFASCIIAIGFLAIIWVMFLNTSTKTVKNSASRSKTIDTKHLCGPLSLLEVCQLYGIKANVKELSVLSKTEARGTSFQGLFEASQQKGLQPIALRLTVDELAQRESPAILHVNENHFFVVKKIERDDVHILDPPKKPYIISRNRLAEMWKGKSLCFEKPIPDYHGISILGPEELIYDIGTVQLQDAVIQTFHIANLTNSPYTVSRIDSSCTCSTASLQIGTIIPSKVTKSVAMKISLSETSSQFEESMKIYVDDSEKPRYILTLRGIVKPPLRLSPRTIYVGKIARMEIVERQATLIAGEGRTVRISSIETSTPAIAVKPLNSEQNTNQIILHIIVSGTLLESSVSNIFDENITVYTDDLEQPRLELPVQGMILDSISCVPNSIFFGVVPKEQSTSKSAEIIVRIPSIKLADAESNSPLLRVDLKPTLDRTKYMITAMLLETAPSGVLKTTINILTEPPTHSLEIPVYALIK